jgi:hypothetical protein
LAKPQKTQKEHFGGLCRDEIFYLMCNLNEIKINEFAHSRKYMTFKALSIALKTSFVAQRVCVIAAAKNTVRDGSKPMKL